jgi:hypothetical protein
MEYKKDMMEKGDKQYQPLRAKNHKGKMDNNASKKTDYMSHKLENQRKVLFEVRSQAWFSSRIR